MTNEQIADTTIAASLAAGLPDVAVRRMALLAWNRVPWGNDPRGAAYRYAKTLADIGQDERFGYMGLAEWAQGGYLHLETTHKFAAALMCTKMTTEDVDEAVDVLPGSVAFVRVPNAIIHGEDGAHINRALVLFLEDKFGTRGAYLWACEAGSLSTRAFGLSATIKAFCEDTSYKRESLLFRLAIGLALTMKHTVDFRDRHVPARGHGSRNRGDPAHRVCIVGRPISVDCRPSLRSFVAGNRNSPPSVQTVVRGHYKRQVVGIARAGRKVIWVQPYWRGPEDAQILVRPYLIGPA